MAHSSIGGNAEFTSALDAALRYAERGWHVFPVRVAPDKKPLNEHGFLEATVDPAVILAWWRRWPHAQVGIACEASGICVVDLDLDHTAGKDGIASWGRLKDDHGLDGCGLVATTPRGGRHYVYLMPDPPPGSRSGVIPGSGIDVRCAGGYIVAPSPSSPGRSWNSGDWADSDDLCQMPAWVLHLVGERRGGTGSAGSESGRVIPLDEAQVAAIRAALAHIDNDPRDSWIRVGMALKSTGARDQAYELWVEWSKSSPKFDERDQIYQWRSIHEFRMDGSEITLGSLFHMAKEAGYVAPTEHEVILEAVPPPSPAPAPTTKRPFPRELMNCPGLVGDIAAWMVESSTRQQRALCLASAIVTMGAVLGRRVATPTDLRTNVYALGIGETACGKDPSLKLPHLLLTRAGLTNIIGPGEWKSDSGLRAELIDKPSHAAYVDEFTKLLAQMSGWNVPGHVKGIKRNLLELWGASNSVHLAPAFANRQINKPVVIEQPNLCVYGVGVPGELFTSLDRGSVSDGFLNRILIFFADDQQPPRRKVGRAEPPASLIDRLKAIVKATEPEGNLEKHLASNARMLPMTDSASAMVERIETENDQRIARMREADDPLSDLWVRYGAHVAKLALIRSASDDPAREICEADVAWAESVVAWCLGRTHAEAESRVADSAQEAATKRVLRLVVSAGCDGLQAGELARRTQWLRRSERKDILQTLVESGQVVCERQQLGGSRQDSTVYVAAHLRSGAVAGNE